MNSKEEQDSYCSINSLVKRLEKQGLLGRLDFTMISACMARLSPQRNDDFELEALKKTQPAAAAVRQLDDDDDFEPPQPKDSKTPTDSELPQAKEWRG